MPTRTLSEAEFSAIQDRLIAQAPKGLSEAEFDRWFTPRFDGAVAEAEQLPPAVEGSAIERFVGGAAEMLNPVTAVSGLVNAVRDLPGTARAIVGAQRGQFDTARQRFGEGRVSEGIGHLAASALPLIGPAAAGAGEQIAAGDVAGGLGTGAGLLVGTAAARPLAKAAGKVIQPVAKAAARKLYQSALKPTKAVLKDVRVPAGAGADAARTALVDTGLREGIAVSGRGAAKAEALIDQLNDAVTARLDDAAARGATVDPATVEAAIRDVAKDFTLQVNAQPDLAAIASVADNFSGNPSIAQPVSPSTPANFAAGRIVGQPAKTAPAPIPVKLAQRIKVNTYKGLRGKYGVERGATIEAEKAGARAIKEGIEAAAPEVAADNARAGALFPLEEAIADAMRRRGNYGVFGLTPIVASIPAIAHGQVWPLLAAMTDRAPGVVSRTAIGLNRVGTTGAVAHRGAQGALVGSTVTSARERPRTTGSGARAPVLVGATP